MRVFLAVAMTVLLASAAFAQQHVPRYGETDKAESPAQIEADKDAARAYQRSLNNIPDHGPTDPWGAVRATDSPKAATAKARKAKTKTGAANN